MATSFFDLTDKQISALSQDDINRYIDYECAMEGIPLLPEKPSPLPKQENQEPDVTIFTLPEITVATQDEANRIIALVSELKLISTNYVRNDYNTRYISREAEIPQLTTKRVFSKETYDRIGEDLEKQKEIQAEYNEKFNDYERAERERKSIVRRVSDQLKEVQDRFKKKSYLRQEWARYIDLAEGNVEIAYNFMSKVHKDLQDHPDLVEEFDIDRLINI